MTAKTVLLIEDDPDDGLMIARAFAKGRIANPVQVARDGAEALAWLFATGDHAYRDARDTPAMILLDLKLPRIDGLEVLRLVRADPHTRLVPVVVLTSSQAEQDLLDSYALRANSFLRKPLDVDRFMAHVAQLGMYWLAINEAPPPLR